VVNRDTLSMSLLAAVAVIASLASGQEVRRPRITGVAHIAFYAHDIERSRTFYTGLLGFQEPYSLKNPDGSLSVAFFKINDHQYVELLPETQANTDRLVRIALETDDAEQLRKYLASRGVEVPGHVTKDRIGNTSFTVADPDKHTVEFVQYEPGGRSMRAKGEFMDDRRASTHLSHVGIIVYALEPAMEFYRDILGCQEIWRGSSDQKTLSWVNMKVPDGDNWVEFMLYDQFPDLRQLGVLHHIGMEETDVAKSAAIFEASPARSSYTRRVDLRGTPPRQFQVYDPDGTRTEIMAPAAPGRTSSTAPPIR
jgi:catechol 2,3-dioxygenase-like lactoylglutathione lyase family enzyme